MNTALGINGVKTYRPLLHVESLALVKNILKDPGNYLGFVRKCVYARSKFICLARTRILNIEYCVSFGAPAGTQAA